MRNVGNAIISYLFKKEFQNKIPKILEKLCEKVYF